MQSRVYLLVCLDRHWQPLHWLTPTAVGSSHNAPACGAEFDPLAPTSHRQIERARMMKIQCADCRRAFRLQEALSRKKRRL